MLRQAIVGGMAVMLALIFPCVERVAAEQPGTASGVTEFVQITTMRLNAGEQTFEVFRILRGGMAEWARWNSSGRLLVRSEQYDIGSETFDRVVSSPIFQVSSKLSHHGGAVGRPAFRLDVAILSESGIIAVSTAKMPDDLAALTERIRREVKAITVQPGWYVWTQPYPQIGKADIDIAESGRDAAIAEVLSEAVAAGRLIVRAEDGVQAFVSGERANRIAFAAKLPIGNLRFGVLSVK